MSTLAIQPPVLHPLFLTPPEDDVCTIMNTDFARVPLDLSVEGLTELLLRRELDAAVVLDGDDELVGVVSTADLLREIHDRGDGAEWTDRPRVLDSGEPMHGFQELRVARSTVEEIMTPLALSIYAGSSIRHAAALMAYEGVAQLPVVSRRRGVVGVVTSREVLRWIGRMPV